MGLISTNYCLTPNCDNLIQPQIWSFLFVLRQIMTISLCLQTRISVRSTQPPSTIYLVTPPNVRFWRQDHLLIIKNPICTSRNIYICIKLNFNLSAIYSLPASSSPSRIWNLRAAQLTFSNVTHGCEKSPEIFRSPGARRRCHAV